MPSSTSLRAVLAVAISVGLCTFGAAQQTKSPSSGAGRSSVNGRSATSKGGARPAPKPRVQQAGATEPAEKKRRPPTEDLRIEPLPPELEQILRDWEIQSAKIQKLHGKHQRIVYNLVFEVEKIGEGEFYYEAPDKGRIDLVGIAPKKDEVSRKISPKTGKPFTKEKEQRSKWICTGQEILNINEDDKTFEVFPLPPDLQGDNIINGPLPFLFGMKAEEAKKRFALSFMDPSKNTDDIVWIVARPRQVMDKDNFQEAIIKLDRKRYLPLAVKLIDPSGNLETIYIFPEKDLHVNSTRFLANIFREKPFQPDLSDYKRILPPKVDRVQQAGGEEGRSRIRLQTDEDVAPPRQNSPRSKR